MTGFKNVAILPRKHPSIGCCGIDCGLCPRYYTGGSSRCPGCGGEGFEQKHPPCGFISCCVKKHGVEVCAGCGEFPCAKFDKETGERDSFVTHRRVMANQKRIAEVGLERFLEEQRRRVVFLETALSQYDDGKSKNFFCLAAALLSIDGLNKALEAAKNGAALRIASAECAAAEEEELKLRK